MGRRYCGLGTKICSFYKPKMKPLLKPLGYGSIPIDTFLVGWTSIYQLFLCSPGVQGFDTLPLLKWRKKHRTRSAYAAASRTRSRKSQATVSLAWRSWVAVVNRIKSRNILYTLHDIYICVCSLYIYIIYIYIYIFIYLFIYICKKLYECL